MEFKKISVNGRVYGTQEEGEAPNEGMCRSSVDWIQYQMGMLNDSTWVTKNMSSISLKQTWSG